MKGYAKKTERAQTFKVIYKKLLTIDKPLSVDKLYHFIMLFKADDYCWSLWDRFCNNILEFVNKYQKLLTLFQFFGIINITNNLWRFLYVCIN